MTRDEPFFLEAAPTTDGHTPPAPSGRRVTVTTQNVITGKKFGQLTAIRGGGA
jgi:hypothetical protein